MLPFLEKSLRTPMTVYLLGLFLEVFEAEILGHLDLDDTIPSNKCQNRYSISENFNYRNYFFSKTFEKFKINQPTLVKSDAPSQKFIFIIL
jgi:hypothetical protein